MRLGALDYFTKPFSMDELRLKIRQHLEARRLKQENLLLKRALNTRHGFSSILGRSDAMQSVFSAIQTVATTTSTVLITGESGTGKELVARAIHFNSLRRDRPFVAVNCGAVPETLLESELFGHMRGAFTDAHMNKKGLMEVAEGGTIFLDEIGEMASTMQVKLLRVIQDRRFRRLGGTDEVQADVRIIAATNQDLPKMVTDGRFREDLYYRLNVMPINIPPLRERKEDIAALATHFVARLSGELGSRAKAVSTAAIQKLISYHWPGNVRELENVLERSLVLATAEVLEAGDIRLDMSPRARPNSAEHFLPEGMSLDDYEQSIIREALKRAGGNKSQAARLLGLTRNALRYRLSQMGIES
jgi:DNA-binding NtrC family response regulator